MTEGRERVIILKTQKKCRRPKKSLKNKGNKLLCTKEQLKSKKMRHIENNSLKSLESKRPRDKAKRLFSKF